MSGSINYNHQHVASGYVISGTDQPITVKELRDALAEYPDDTELIWGTCNECGAELMFQRFKDRSGLENGRKVLQIDIG